MGGCSINHILVIDDEDDVVHSIGRVLRHSGYDVTVAYDGEEGIKLFDETRNFDLVITGISMPRMSGNDVAKHIRSTGRANTPVVAMTGSGEDAIETELFNFFLIKPFKLTSLIETIKSFT